MQLQALHRPISGCFSGCLPLRFDQSLAFPASPVLQVECIPTCAEHGGGPKYPPVSAGDYLAHKYASTHATFAAHNPDVAAAAD